MSKKILTLYYTQSGQLEEIATNFLKPLIEAGHTVEMHHLKPVDDFPFPWQTAPIFFDAMPESVKQVPKELQSFQLKESRYDLVVFAWQPWFLSPSIPANSMLQNETIKAVLKDTQVITLIGSRNMWLNAQEKVKKLLKDAGAILVGNIALADRGNNQLGVLTIFHWMLNGKKERKWGILPVPGVAQKDIDRVPTYGAIAEPYISKGSYEGMQKELVNAKAVEIRYNLIYIESKAGIIFKVWGKLIYG